MSGQLIQDPLLADAWLRPTSTLPPMHRAGYGMHLSGFEERVSSAVVHSNARPPKGRKRAPRAPVAHTSGSRRGDTSPSSPDARERRYHGTSGCGTPLDDVSPGAVPAGKETEEEPPSDNPCGSSPPPVEQHSVPDTHSRSPETFAQVLAAAYSPSRRSSTQRPSTLPPVGSFYPNEFAPNTPRQPLTLEPYFEPEARFLFRQ
jgi:hypothetical protein